MHPVAVASVAEVLAWPVHPSRSAPAGSTRSRIIELRCAQALTGQFHDQTQIHHISRVRCRKRDLHLGRSRSSRFGDECTRSRRLRSRRFWPWPVHPSRSARAGSTRSRDASANARGNQQHQCESQNIYRVFPRQGIVEEIRIAPDGSSPARQSMHPSRCGRRPDRAASGASAEPRPDSEFDILFLGDSITDLWNVEADPQGNPGGKRVFSKYFGDLKVANFGISGDTTQGVLWRLQNGESKGHKPKAVLLMLGTNNAGGSSGAEIAEGLGAIVLPPLCFSFRESNFCCSFSPPPPPPRFNPPGGKEARKIDFPRFYMATPLFFPPPPKIFQPPPPPLFFAPRVFFARGGGGLKMGAARRAAVVGLLELISPPLYPFPPAKNIHKHQL